MFLPTASPFRRTKEKDNMNTVMERPAGTTTTTGLAARAFNKLRHFLVNTAKTNPTEAQLKALYALMDNFSQLTHKTITGRYAWALPVGCGKTTSASLFVAEAIKEGYSFVIACGQLSGLNDINDFLVKTLHVPQHLIGTMVSKDLADMVAGRSVVNGEEYPILLVTHARVHMGNAELQRYWTYRGAKRSLLIYDESLISSKSVMTPIEEVSNGLDILTGRLQRQQLKVSKDFYKTLQYLVGSFEMEQKALHRDIEVFLSTHPEGTPVPSELCYVNFYLDALDTDKFSEDIKTLAEHTWSDGLLKFLSLCGTQVRLVATNLDNSILSFTVTVPDDIQNMVILDASSPIRLLAEMDSKVITMAEYLPLVKQAGIRNLAALFNYSNVTWHCYRAGGGRHSFKNDKQNLKIKDAVGLLKTIPAQDSVLFYVFKKQTTHPKEVDLLKTLQGELVKQGYDLASPSLCIETFGRETSSNNYRHCQHVIFVGTPWPNKVALVGQMLGQKRSMTIHLDDTLIEDVEASEVAYRFHQGAGRGSMRVNMPDGRPSRMTAYSFLTDTQRAKLMPLLRKVMPGMVTPELPLRKSEQTTKKCEALESWLIQKLAGISSHRPETPDSFRTSITTLKRDWKAANVLKCNKETFTKALESVLKRSEGWSRQGRSLVYKRA